MSGEGYRGAGTIGGKWGCALSALAGIPLIGGAAVISAFGDCAPGVACHHDVNWRLFAGAILVAIGIGFGTRLLVNILFRRLRALPQQQRPDSSPE